MNTLKQNAIAMVIGALIFVPLSPTSARADDDDDDWEDRWEERWDEDDDDFEDRWERGYYHRRGWYRDDGPRGYRVYDGPRYYRYYDEPRYRYYYPERRHVYRYYEPYPPVYRHDEDDYDNRRHGAIRVGPFYVEW
jgi:hypothetical protein